MSDGPDATAITFTCQYCDHPAPELDDEGQCPSCSHAMQERRRLELLADGWFQLSVFLRSGDDANEMIVALSDPDTVAAVAQECRTMSEEDSFEPTRRQRLERAKYLDALTAALRQRESETA